MGFDGCTIPHHVSRACWVRWEPVSRIECPNSHTRDRRWGRAIVLEDGRLLDAYFCNRGSPTIEPFVVRSTVFLCLRPRSIALGAAGKVRTLISSCLWWGTSKLSHGSPFDLLSVMSVRVLSMKASRQSTLGYTHSSSLSADRCASYELDGDARHKDFIQVRPSYGRSTYVLHRIVLLWTKLC